LEVKVVNFCSTEDNLIVDWIVWIEQQVVPWTLAIGTVVFLCGVSVRLLASRPFFERVSSRDLMLLGIVLVVIAVTCRLTLWALSAWIASMLSG
jgi:hypothetical protein